MKVLVLFVCLSSECLALKSHPHPHPCRIPPLLTGSFSVSTSDETMTVFTKYIYDALGKRIRLKECVSLDNKTSYYDVLLLFKEKVMYQINNKNHTCTKMPLDATFHPLAIPKTASLLGQVVLGSSSGPRQGLVVNTWVGEMQITNESVKYMSTVTEFGCVPVTTLLHTRSGWEVFSFFNNVMGIRDPDQLLPPSFCKDAQLEEDDREDPTTFFRLFENTEIESEM